jgi:hypothetical protein
VSAPAIIHVRIHVIILAVVRVVLHAVVRVVDRAKMAAADHVQATVVVVAAAVMVIAMAVLAAAELAPANAGKVTVPAHAQFIAMMKRNAMVAVIRSVAVLRIRVDGGTYYGRKDYPSNEEISS